MTTGRKQAKLLDMNEKDDGAVAVRVDNVVATGPHPIVKIHGNDAEIARSRLTMQERKNWEEYVEFLTNTSRTDLPELLEALVEHSNDFDYALELSASPKAVAFLLGLLDDEDGDVRGKAALILGSAFSNNPIVQERATLNFGCYETLWEKLQTESDPLVLRRLFFAFSALVRSNPSAIQMFDEGDGLSMLQALLEKAEDAPVLKRKIVALIADLADPGMVGSKL